MKKILFLFLLLGLCTIPVLAETGNTYAPYPSGGWIAYSVYPIAGTWNDTTGALDITWRGSVQEPQTIAFSDQLCDHVSGTTYNSYYHLAGTPNAPAVDWASLQNAVYTLGEAQYIGEAVDQYGHVKMPPEAIISMNPIAGEVIDSPNTVVYETCDSSTITQSNFHWKYRTVAHYDTWDQFSDVWRTSLREYASDNSGYVYNYVWKSGLGLVNFWYGTLNVETWAVSGYEFYATSWGENTPTPSPTAPTHTPTPTSTAPPSGSYIPALFNTTNLLSSSVNGSWYYMVVGNNVMVWGSLQAQAAASGTTELEFSLPIYSDFLGFYDLSGNGTAPGNTPASIISVSAADRARMVWVAPAAGNIWWRIVFGYTIK